MNKTEYWFLDAAIRLKIPLNWLAASNVDELLNRPHHKLSKTELPDVLQRMFEQGILFLEYKNRSGQTSRTQTPSRREIEAALYMSHDVKTRASQQVFYGVTERGGAMWETLSHPRWEYFFDESYGVDPYKGEMTAPTRGFIEARLALVPYDTLIQAIVLESVRWSILKPWDATYWKQLPLGYRIEFIYLPLSEAERLTRSSLPDPVPAWYQRANKWYISYPEQE